MNVIVGLKFAFNVFHCCLLAYSCPKCQHLRIAIHIEGFADTQWPDLHLECGCRCWDLVLIILEYVIALIDINSTSSTSRPWSWLLIRENIHEFTWHCMTSFDSYRSHGFPFFRCSSGAYKSSIRHVFIIVFIEFLKLYMIPP